MRRLLAGLLLVGCGDAPPASVTWTTADSAGVTIVTSLEPAWNEGEGWELADTPSLSIGAVDEEGAALLFGVGGATRLDDGRIVVLNSGDGTLRFFDAEGRHVLTAAGLGQGPGELQRPAGLARRGDTLVVSEIFGQRISRFDLEGVHQGTMSLDNVRLNEAVDSQWGCPRRPEATTDGSYLFCAGSGRPAPIVPGVRRVSHWLVRATLDASAVDTVGVVHGASRELLLGPQGSAVAMGGTPPEVYVGDPASFTIDVWANGGGQMRSLRYPAGLQPVGARERTFLSERSSGYTPPPNAVYAPNLPAFQLLVRDATGHLWAVLHEEFWPGAGVAQVFAPGGHLLGRVALPPRFRPWEIGDTYLLGVTRDELDVERVELYRLDRR